MENNYVTMKCSGTAADLKLISCIPSVLTVESFDAGCARRHQIVLVRVIHLQTEHVMAD